MGLLGYRLNNYCLSHGTTRLCTVIVLTDVLDTVNHFRLKTHDVSEISLVLQLERRKGEPTGVDLQDS